MLPEGCRFVLYMSLAADDQTLVERDNQLTGELFLQPGKKIAYDLLNVDDLPRNKSARNRR